ncbi:uncharacterized protein F5891DRAFT_1279955 [Suillus fuscotomentosus]|uniref:DUF6533 domain-containing protein n=1 Tax=Suillus fuscotomentosus TaxID=1912939 RepID=A0AAD4HII0_9AGAM|nr:uncharacterized protein F5891DRAFT_1279955 [Suillus fuscotomentosus]KAG1897747.1 hypothetical protein F5891DRAFT_1279955 [Suillus fuscotomentosus]
MVVLMRFFELIDLPKCAPSMWMGGAKPWSTSSAPHSSDLKIAFLRTSLPVPREDWRRARGRGKSFTPTKTQQDLEDEKTSCGRLSASWSVLKETPNGGISSTNAVIIHSPSPLAHTNPSNMTYVSNDPSYWPYISAIIGVNHYTVAAAIVVVYDWVLTLGQEIELIWRQRWSLMTVLYLIVHTLYWNTIFSCQCSVYYAIGIADRCRVIGIFGANARVFTNWESLGAITFYVANAINVALAAMLGVIMIARLHAMYQGSRAVLMFLVIIFLAVNIACGVMVAIGLNDGVAEERILSGIHMCGVEYGGDEQLLISIIWILNTVWEVLALCLSVWVAVKHFRELRRLGPSTGSAIGDCFRVLVQSHVLYFASFVGVSCLQLVDLSPEIANSNSIGAQILVGTLEILSVVQMFVLGPRLILSV